MMLWPMCWKKTGAMKLKGHASCCGRDIDEIGVPSAEGTKLWEQTCRYLIIARETIKGELWMFNRCSIWYYHKYALYNELSRLLDRVYGLQMSEGVALTTLLRKWFPSCNKLSTIKSYNLT
jgi:hypothetical protein